MSALRSASVGTAAPRRCRSTFTFLVRRVLLSTTTTTVVGDKNAVRARLAALSVVPRRADDDDPPSDALARADAVVAAEADLDEVDDALLFHRARAVVASRSLRAAAATEDARERAALVRAAVGATLRAGRATGSLPLHAPLYREVAAAVVAATPDEDDDDDDETRQRTLSDLAESLRRHRPDLVEALSPWTKKTKAEEPYEKEIHQHEDDHLRWLVYYRDDEKDWSLPDVTAQLVAWNDGEPLRFTKRYEDHLLRQIREDIDDYDGVGDDRRPPHHLFSGDDYGDDDDDEDECEYLGTLDDFEDELDNNDDDDEA